MAVLFQKMVMAGVGLICGSLALDVRRKKVVKEIVGYGRGESNLRLAKRKGIIDGYFLREDEFPRDADFLMLGTPVQTIVPITKTFLPRISAGCVISDVGSVKGEIVRGMERLLPKNIFFVAGHPIAGSEQWGAQAAQARSVRPSSLYFDTDEKDRSPGARQSCRPMAQGRSGCRVNAAGRSRSGARTHESFAPCLGLRVGKRIGAQAVARCRS